MPETSTSKTRKRLVSIDVLRGIAVLAVVLCHLPFSAVGLGGTAAAGAIFPPMPVPHVLEYGRLGVQLFLLLSGFCIHMRWARKADPTKKVDFFPFWKRRLTRLYPPYFIALVGALVATFALHNVVGSPAGPGLGAMFGYASTTTFVVDMVLLLLLMQNLTPAAWRVNNGPFWSLALEEQLYLMYFPLLWMRRNWGWGKTIAVCGVATLAWRATGAFLFEETPFFWFIVGPAFWLPWALGAFAVEAHFGHVRLPKWATSAGVGVALFAAGVLCNPPADMWGIYRYTRVLDDLFYSGAFFVLINVFVHYENAGRLHLGAWVRVLAQFGVWSYSIYLVHLLAMVPVKQLLVEFGFSDPLILAVRLGAGLLAGMVFFRLFEVPFHQLARKVKARLVDVEVDAAESPRDTPIVTPIPRET